MKLFLGLLLTLTLAAQTQAPQLTDADKLSLVIAQRNFYAAQAQFSDAMAQCPNIEKSRTAAMKHRDAYQAQIDRLKKDQWNLNLDTLQYEPKS